MTDYIKEAKDFLKRNNAKMTISFKDCVYGAFNDNEYHNIYRVRIDRNHKTYSFDFTDSAYNTERNERPNCYDVLACLEKYEPYSTDVWDFAEEFGYEIHDRESYKKVEKTFKAVKKEYANVMRLFGDVIEELTEIQ